MGKCGLATGGLACCAVQPTGDRACAAVPCPPLTGPPPASQGPLPKLSLSDIAKRKEVGLVAGGTGLTPMLQVATEALRQGLPLKLSFIFANVSEDDIVMRKHLDGLAAKHDNFRVYYGEAQEQEGGGSPCGVPRGGLVQAQLSSSLARGAASETHPAGPDPPPPTLHAALLPTVVDKATSKSWPGGVGFITKVSGGGHGIADVSPHARPARPCFGALARTSNPLAPPPPGPQDMLKQHLPHPGPDSLVLVCGPPGMMGALSGDKLPDKSQGPLTGLLKELGFDESNVYKF